MLTKLVVLARTLPTTLLLSRPFHDGPDQISLGVRHLDEDRHGPSRRMNPAQRLALVMLVLDEDHMVDGICFCLECLGKRTQPVKESLQEEEEHECWSLASITGGSHVQLLDDVWRVAVSASRVKGEEKGVKEQEYCGR